MDYYRKPINKVANDLKLKMRMAALTLKITENANKLDQMKSDISENYNDIGNIELLSYENKANISTNTNKVNLLYQAHKEIEIDITLIENNLNNTYIINNITSEYINLLDKKFIFNNNNTYYEIYELLIENSFMKNNYIEVNSCVLFDYKEYNHLGAISSIYIFLDSNDFEFYRKESKHSNAGDNYLEYITQHDDFIFKLGSNYDKIKIKISLELKQNISNNISLSTVKSNINKIFIKNFHKIKFC